MSSTPSDEIVGHIDRTKIRTKDIYVDHASSFASLSLPDFIVQGLSRAGFERPSPVQLRALPIARSGIDTIVQAKSGTGKTCVFAVVSLEAVHVAVIAPQALILAPTREIAVQINSVISAVAKDTPIMCNVFIGGVPIQSDIQALKSCQIVVGTPGRILELIQNNHLHVDDIRVFVLDEADQILEPNFRQQIRTIFNLLPTRKQVLAFSATYTKSVEEVVLEMMSNPVQVRLDQDKPSLHGVKQLWLEIEANGPAAAVFEAKTAALLEVLEKFSFKQCVVFSNFRSRAESLAEMLCKKNWPADFISSDQDQKSRLETMGRFRAYQIRVLVSTDLTARGIDLEHVNLVINLDIPLTPDTYLHRIGRSGRFGTLGVALTILASSEKEQFTRFLNRCNTTATQFAEFVKPPLLETSSAVTESATVSISESVSEAIHEESNSSKQHDSSHVQEETETTSLDFSEFVATTMIDRPTVEPSVLKSLKKKGYTREYVLSVKRKCDEEEGVRRSKRRVSSKRIALSESTFSLDRKHFTTLQITESIFGDNSSSLQPQTFPFSFGSHLSYPPITQSIQLFASLFTLHLQQGITESRFSLPAQQSSTENL